MDSVKNTLYPRFELVTGYDDESLLPSRATVGSAGYDFAVAADTIIPSYHKIFSSGDLSGIYEIGPEPFSFDEAASFTKQHKCKPTLVPTGVKAYIPKGYSLQLFVRSSCPLKAWLILANGVGVIDADYYNNPDNEGHIYLQIINLFPHDIILHKGDKIGQGIFLPFNTTWDDRTKGLRSGGFGSTSNKGNTAT